MIYFNNELRTMITRPYALFFDVDDVLVDAGRSFPEAAASAAQRYLKECNLEAENSLPNKIRSIKRRPGFNDDWDMAEALTLFLLQRHSSSPVDMDAFLDSLDRRGGRLSLQEWIRNRPGDLKAWIESKYDSERVRLLAKAYYGGPDWCRSLYGFDAFDFIGQGAISTETLLVDPARLKRLDTPWSIYTGRTRNELEPVLAGMNIKAPGDTFCMGSGLAAKPDPSPLVETVDKARVTGLIFAGDNPDDRETVVRFRRERPDVAAAFVRIAGGGCPHDPRDSCVENVNQLIDLLLGEDCTCENRH